MYNVVKHDPGVIKAINPVYIVDNFIRNKKNAWISLGGIILCLTGVYHNLISLFKHFECTEMRCSDGLRLLHSYYLRFQL